MALIIEDGSIVEDANSFTTDAEFVAYADARGYTLPDTESVRDQLQIKAMDYLIKGHMLADVPAVLGSLDIVFGEVDR